MRTLIVAVSAVFRDLIRVGFRTRTQVIAENLYGDNWRSIRNGTTPTSTHSGGQASAGRVGSVLSLGNSTRHREAMHIRSLAPSRFPTVLAMEIAIGGSPAATEEHTNADRHHGERESELGRRADCQ